MNNNNYYANSSRLVMGTHYATVATHSGRGEDFKTHVQRRDQLSYNCTLCYKMESIHTKIKIKGQGSRELVETETEKEE